VVGIHLVDQPQLDLVADTELPGDRVVDGARLLVDEVPAQVRGRRDPVDVEHVVLPLDPAGRFVLLVVLVVLVSPMSSSVSSTSRCAGDQ